MNFRAVYTLTQSAELARSDLEPAVRIPGGAVFTLFIGSAAVGFFLHLLLLEILSTLISLKAVHFFAVSTLIGLTAFQIQRR